MTQEAIGKFEDDQAGGFFLTADESEKLIVRPKESNDTAIPSGNSVMMLNLLRVGRINGNPKFEEKAERIAKAFSEGMSRSPSFAVSVYCSAMRFRDLFLASLRGMRPILEVPSVMSADLRSRTFSNLTRLRLWSSRWRT